jgi:hypothetical protein
VGKSKRYKQVADKKTISASKPLWWSFAATRKNATIGLAALQMRNAVVKRQLAALLM